MRYAVIRFSKRLLITLAPISLAACGLNQQDPSFIESRSSVSIALTIDDNGNVADSENAVSADDASAHLDRLDETEVLDILDSLDSGGDEWSQQDADATAAVGGVAGKSSLPGDSSSDSTDVELNGSSTADTTDDHGNSVVADETDSSGGSGDEQGTFTTGEESTSSDSTAASDAGINPKDAAKGGDDNSSGSGSTGGDDVVAPTKAELRACAQLNGIPVERVKIAGNKGNANIQSNTVIAIKLAGNQSDLNLQLAGSGDVAGLCLFVTGNQASAKVKSSVALGNFIYIGRGNRSSGDLDVQELGVVSSVVADLRGNQAKLSIHGNGSFYCNTARVNDKKGGFQCK